MKKFLDTIIDTVTNVVVLISIIFAFFLSDALGRYNTLYYSLIDESDSGTKVYFLIKDMILLSKNLNEPTLEGYFNDLLVKYVDFIDYLINYERKDGKINKTFIKCYGSIIEYQDCTSLKKLNSYRDSYNALLSYVANNLIKDNSIFIDQYNNLTTYNQTFFSQRQKTYKVIENNKNIYFWIFLLIISLIVILYPLSYRFLTWKQVLIECGILFFIIALNDFIIYEFNYPLDGLVKINIKDVWNNYLIDSKK